MENKQRICDLLVPVLKETRNLHNLESLIFNPKNEIVTATFNDGYTKKADVTADSGTSMIRDIIKSIV